MTITAVDLTKRYGEVTALDAVSFSVPTGAFFAVVGPSGCGKSTLFRLVAGLEHPDTGKIILNGEDVAGSDAFVPPEQRQVGVVFQSYALWPHMTVEGNVAFPYEAQGLSKDAARAEALAHIKTVALEPLKDRRPDALSGGQRQRVALARCLAGEARTILMDEPLANLDPHLRSEMEAELKAFHTRTGVTTLYITHDQREAMALADVMAVMDQGRFLQMGPPREIFERPATAKVARFIGRGAVLKTRVASGCAAVGALEVPVTARQNREGPAEILVRPRDVTLGGNGLPARIAAVHYRGGVWEARAEAEGVAEMVEIDCPAPVNPGDMVQLKISSAWVIPD
ncbi:MAG: ABC transporter ATP-binding protein [Pseudomonadota bacterium]